MDTALNKEVKKLQVEEIVLFAINNIPGIDTTTLTQFLDLVNAGGTFGTISHEQVLKKMQKVLKYIPGANVHSLLILTDLLEIELPAQLLVSTPQTNRLNSNEMDRSTMAFIIEGTQAMASTNSAAYSG